MMNRVELRADVRTRANRGSSTSGAHRRLVTCSAKGVPAGASDHDLAVEDLVDGAPDCPARIGVDSILESVPPGEDGAVTDHVHERPPEPLGRGPVRA
jgi:hypothetical protein